jgi:hypothetical protein
MKPTSARFFALYSKNTCPNQEVADPVLEE